MDTRFMGDTDGNKGGRLASRFTLVYQDVCESPETLRFDDETGALLDKDRETGALPDPKFSQVERSFNGREHSWF